MSYNIICILLIIILLTIIIKNILAYLDIVEGLTGEKEYYDVNGQKLKIDTLKNNYDNNYETFKKYKKKVGEHSKIIGKQLGKKVGIHK